MYTIQILRGGVGGTLREERSFALRAAKRDRLVAVLQADIVKDGRFRVHHFLLGECKTTMEERRLLTSIYGGESAIWHTLPAIFLQGPTPFGGAVRLTAPKAYCGNHPGPCQVKPFFQKPKVRSTSLEWDDWVAFHALVNKACNRLRVHANVWTNPQDAKGKFWIRRGTQARLKWDYTEMYRHGREVRVWNTGTPDQFTGSL